MHYPCPHCGGQLPIIDEEKRWLFAETGRLLFENKRLLEENQSLKEALLKLQQVGVTDQFGRKLPLPDHHRECPHGQNGLAMCTCEELKARDIERTNNLLKALADGLDEDLKED